MAYPALRTTSGSTFFLQLGTRLEGRLGTHSSRALPLLPLLGSCVSQTTASILGVLRPADHYWIYCLHSPGLGSQPTPLRGPLPDPPLPASGHRRRMEPRAYSQHTAWAAVTGALMAMLLFQAAGGLECYSCTEEGDGGCSPANITAVQCAPPMKICTEYWQTLAVGATTVTIHKRGCNSGPPESMSGWFTHLVLESNYKMRACTTDLCNLELTNIIQPALAGNTTESNSTVPNGMECYSCLSFSKDDCVPENAEKVNCTGDMKHCYEGNITVTINNDNTSKLLYVKTCVHEFSCLTRFSTSDRFGMISEQSSCCSEILCNGSITNATTTSEPNS
ncbi:ly6/PLAUR domain-containing protein 3-like [Rhinatrema bivittatum]|uniref:ly6/PLAUR domain-containing protein 3-like n=1 Tax=Rhinatrema bivittatum TaxID=194408 RepID=UPI001128B80D|nr:ly6/PLAUR domain-containing protein 3-like [Rhinatrema bivittatum]